jgi:flagellar hook-length control protein FliK
MNLQLAQKKSNLILKWRIILTTIKSKNIENEFSVAQSPYKRATSNTHLVTESSFQDLLDNKIKSNPAKNQSSSVNIDPSNHTNKSHKETEKSATVENKKNSHPHEKIEKNHTNQSTIDLIPQSPVSTETISQDRSESLLPKKNELPSTLNIEAFQNESFSSEAINTEVADKNTTLLNIAPPLVVSDAFPLTKSINNTSEKDSTSSNDIQIPIGASSNMGISTTSTLSTSSATSANFFNTSNWQHEVTHKIIWMNNSNNQSATLILNSQELGPLKVVIHVNNAQADTNFTTNNPHLRQALEDGISNLREMMKQSGVELGQTNINSGNEQNSDRKSQSNGHQISNKINISSNHLNISPTHSLPASLNKSNSIINTFA